MTVKRADDVPARPVEIDGAVGVEIRLLIHEADDAPNFYMRQFDVAPGGCTPLHQHAWEHEVYVLAGAGVAVGPDGDCPVAAGDCVFVAGGDRHQFRNTGEATLKFLCLVPKTAQ